MIRVAAFLSSRWPIALSVVVGVFLLSEMSSRQIRSAVLKRNNAPVEVSIDQGRLNVPKDRTTESTTPGKHIDICANKHVSLRFKSEDFVYTVQITGTEYAQVVLPGGAAELKVKLPTGTFELKLVQGCGRLSPTHASVLYLHAVPG